MSEQQLVQTVKTLDTQRIEHTLHEVVRGVGISLLVLLILASVWYGATELLVLGFKGAWSFGPRYS